MQAFSHYLAELSFIYGHSVAFVPQICLDLGYLVARCLDGTHCHRFGSISILMCIVTTALGQ